MDAVSQRTFAQKLRVASRRSVCVNCLARPLRVGFRRCAVCAAASRQCSQAIKARHRAMGCCAWCWAPLAATSSWLCERHLEQRAASRLRARIRKGRGSPGRRVGGTGMGVRVEHTAVPGPRL